MRLCISILLFLCISLNKGICQDTLQVIGSNTLQVKILEVSPKEVRYKLFEEPNGPVYSVVRSAVMAIHYEDGSHENLEQAEPPIPAPDTLIMDWAERGRLDADSNYCGKQSGTFWVGGATVLFTPILGWIPALVVASFPPSESHLNIFDYKLRHNQIYYESYRKEAHKIKKDKVWTSYAKVTAIWFSLARLGH